MKRLVLTTLLLASTQANATALIWDKRCPLPPGALVCSKAESAHIAGPVWFTDTDYPRARKMALDTGDCRVNKKTRPIAEADMSIAARNSFRGSFIWKIRLTKGGPWRYVPSNNIYDPYGFNFRGECTPKVPS